MYLKHKYNLEYDEIYMSSVILNFGLKKNIDVHLKMCWVIYSFQTN